MTIQHANDNNYSDLTNKKGLVLVDFWATWCGPCKMIAPALEEIANEFKNQVDVVKVDIDVATKTVQEFEILSVPTLWLYKNGEVVDTRIGYQPKEELVDFIKQHL